MLFPLRFIFLLISILFFLFAAAQDLPGIRTGNYTGVNGVFYNPASIADSRYKFDVNLFTIQAGAANNKASFGLGNLETSGEDFEDQLVGANAGLSSGIINLSIHGPSVMFSLGSKNAFAVTTRARFVGNIIDVDGKLLDKISEDINSSAGLPYSISSNSDMRITANAWTEYGISAARVLYQNGQHFLKGGATLKYLAGAGNAYISISQLNASLDNDLIIGDVYAHNTTGHISMGFGGTNNDLFSPGSGNFFSSQSSGIGADLGFVYEFRPPGSAPSTSRHLNKYKLRAGFALLDLGSIKYKKDMGRTGGYTIGITGSEKFYLSEIDNADIDGFKDLFDSRPQYFTPDAANLSSDYSVALPATIQVDADYHIHHNFYVNLLAQFPINGKDVQNVRSYTTIGLTPRFEGKIIGVYVPVYYSSLSKLNAGLSVKLGPVFFGSGSILSAVAGKSKQIDMHFGIRFGGRFKK